MDLYSVLIYKGRMEEEMYRIDEDERMTKE